MKTFLKWHVPVAERWQAEPAGKWNRFPVHPLNILSMFPPWPQNHSNVSLPSPPPSDPGSARRSARRKVPEAPPLPREEPRPAWRLAGFRVGTGHPRRVLPSSGHQGQFCFPRVNVSMSRGRPSGPLGTPSGSGDFFFLLFLIPTPGHGGHRADLLGTRFQVRAYF